MNWLKRALFLFRYPFLWLIWVYQRTISFDHGPLRVLFPHGYCRFYPSCSEYAREAIKQKGLWVGIPKAVWRVLRCNPWNKGGVDPV